MIDDGKLGGGADGPIGFVGLGAMGAPMARRILASGRRVRVWDRRPEAIQQLADLGAEPAGTLGDFADVSVAISIVFDDAATREVALGPGGLLRSLPSGATHIAMASISPELTRELAEAHAATGQGYLAAPVFGRPHAAADGTLRINCSGAAELFKTLTPLLATMGAPRWVGPRPDQALLLKLMGNNMIFAAIELIGEMFAFLSAGGIAEETVMELLVEELFPGPIFGGYARAYMADPASAALSPLAYKDNDLCLAAAREFGLDLPMVRFLQQRLAAISAA